MNFEQKVGHATKWSTITEFLTKLTIPLTNAILARLLDPEAFGVVATLSLVITFSEIFTDAGFQKYIVQHEFENDEDLNLSTDVAFWTNLVLSFLIWILITIFVHPVARWIGATGHETAIAIIGGQIPLMGFSSIQMARYRRSFAFKDLFVVRMSIALVPLIITVPCALIMRNYWALLAGNLVRDLLRAIVFSLRSGWKPKLRYSIKKLKEMISFSIWSVIENIMIWLSTNLGTIIVSTSLGAYYIGLYKTTNTTVYGYMGMFTVSTMPVLFSALSRCQNDRVQFESIYFKFQRMVALIIIPLGFGCLIYRELVTTILLGSQWKETSGYLGMLFFTYAMEIIFSHYNSEAFRSQGKPRLSVLAQFIYIVVKIPLFLWGAQYGYAVLTVITCISSYILIFLTSTIANIALGIHFTNVLCNVWPSMAASCLMAVVGIMAQRISHGFLWQVVSVGICVAVYASTMLVIPAGRRQFCEIPILKRVLRL